MEDFGAWKILLALKGNKVKGIHWEDRYSYLCALFFHAFEMVITYNFGETHLSFFVCC